MDVKLKQLESLCDELADLNKEYQALSIKVTGKLANFINPTVAETSQLELLREKRKQIENKIKDIKKD